MRTDELDFDLPPELIAQTPAPVRDASRLLHYRANGAAITHRRFADLPEILRPGDLLVTNDAKVIAAKFALRKSSGGAVEGLFLSESTVGLWRVLLKNAGKLPPGSHLRFDADPPIAAIIEQRIGQGEFELRVDSTESAATLLARIGRMPLPPYIRRSKHADQRDAMDRQRYQTIYAGPAVAVAAPTAGLHFTHEIFASLKDRGIEMTSITLHVGAGTFKPVTAQTLAGHHMHNEKYSISQDAAIALNAATAQRRRIVAVGTTAARVLESHPQDQPWVPAHQNTSIFIYPPYRWKHVGALITNFHLPRSTLIGLVAAWAGLQEQRRIYRAAIENRYRFYSYGDAMLAE